MKKTCCWRIDPENPDPERLSAAGEFIRAGKLVAFPTETVYGLGANALDPAAVARIFEAKGRPATNPLIVHIADLSSISTVAAEWPPAAAHLAAIHWPGPLTLIVNKASTVPAGVTAGGPTVAVRMPSHPVARGLINAAGVPIAAPSANRSTEISPTTARHVLKGLAGRIDLVLDGGSTDVGIESTVLDVTTTPPTLWRAGMISQVELERQLGPIVLPNHRSRTGAPSPGQLRKHYAPRAEVVLVPFGDVQRLETLLAAESAPAGVDGPPVGCLAFQPHPLLSRQVVMTLMPGSPSHYASELYSALHAMEDAGVGRLIIEDVPSGVEWDGVRDRLHRAAAQ